MNMFIEQFAKNFDIPIEEAMNLYPTLQNQWITYQILQVFTVLAVGLLMFCVVVATVHWIVYVQESREGNPMLSLSLKSFVHTGLDKKSKTYFLYALTFVGIIIWLRVSTLWLCPDYEFLQYILNYG